MRQVTSYSPKIRATIHTRSEGEIDLTSEILSGHVSRGINQPAGQWSLTLTGAGSLADRIAPMDYIEIYMARTPTSTGILDLIMRGFVDNVSQTTAPGTRRVQINGRDYGKLLMQFQVYYLNELDPTMSLIPQARLEINFGLGSGLITPQQFVVGVNRSIVSPNIDALTRSNSAIPQLRTAVKVPRDLAVNGLSIQQFTGSVWNLLSQYASRPWIEMFVIDRLDGPDLVFRYAPLKTYDNAWIDSSYSAAFHTIPNTSIEQMNVSTSDNEVYSYYFTYPVYSFLERQAVKAEGIDVQRNPKLDQGALDLYGFRPLEVATTLIPALVGIPHAEAEQQRSNTLEIAASLNDWMYRANVDNARFRSGSITVQGAGTQPGTYARFPDLGWEYYVASVSHEFSVEGGSYRTTLGVVRGCPA
jgi:protein involved in polysaccharide export with SLBB domain